jgi:radical SAM family uncharacterized protein
MPLIDPQLLHRILPDVQKPGRYTGGEWNSVVKDWKGTHVRVALAFPDIYDLGMSNLGLFLLYDIINRRPDMLAERVFLPWPDMEAAMKQADLPLYSLENKRPILDFDILGISLPYEQLYTNTLNLLDLARLPLLSTARDEQYPLVIAGGHATYNPEPMSDFIDLFVIGEGEEVILDIAETYHRVRDQPRESQLRALARISGVYVPRFYEVSYERDGTICQIQPTVKEAQFPVTKRIVPVLPPPPTRFIVPFVKTTHDRAVIEIQRGCTRGCRFCHAGMVTRPVRERPVQEILDAVDGIVRETGYEEVGLLSLSSSDYSDAERLVQAINEQYSEQHLSISLPSLRIDSFSVALADGLKSGRRSGFTFAPEAATEKMRKSINKYVPTRQVIETAHEVFERGWRTIKLYFMIGHPDETLEDVQAIVDMVWEVLKEGRRVHHKAAQVNVGVSTFVPKPHTPFQWAPLDAMQHIEAKQSLLQQGLRGKGLKLNWSDPQETQLEALLSRGDRRLGQVIHRAWQLGARFDAWHEYFKPKVWWTALEEAGLDPDFYTRRSRALDETLPWDHIDVGVRKQYLLQDYLMSQQGKTRQDCREHCFNCGILSTFAHLRSEVPDKAWKCPPVKAASEQQEAVQSQQLRGGQKTPLVSV